MQLQALISLWGAIFWSAVVYANEWREERYPTFFASGSHDAKIQISLKRELIEKSSLYFAYTLRGIWLRDVPSTPFKELMHRPEVFWTSPYGDLGYEHLSNGLDNQSSDFNGERKRSRSLQRIYWQDLDLLQSGRFRAGLKLMVPVYIKKSSPYHQYMGFQDLIISHQTQHSAVVLSGGLGRKGGHFVSDISVNPIAFLDSVWADRNHTWLFAEYYQGYAETLIDYDQPVTTFRIGLRLLL